MTKRKKEYEDEEKESSESAAQKRSRIINSIEKNRKFLTLKDSEELLYFSPSDGQWHYGDVYLKQFVVEETTVLIIGSGGISMIDFTTNMFREIKEIIKIHSYADPKEFVSPPEWINLKNGALNVLTSHFIPRDPEPDCNREELEIKTMQEEMQKKIREVRETPDTVEADRIKDGIRNDYLVTIRAKRDRYVKSQVSPSITC